MMPGPQYGQRSRGSQGSPPFGHGYPMSPLVLRLIIANFAIYLLMALGIIPTVAIEWLGFGVPGFITRPWTIVTYMFLHGSFMHVFMNMLALFFFGPPLERRWGRRLFLKYYILTGLGGAAASVLLYSALGPTLMIGASGAVFGLLVAFALNWPDARILLWFVFPVKAKWFVIGLGAFTLLSTAQGSADGVAHWAHLGGLVSGYVYLRYGERIGRAASRAFFTEKPARPPKQRRRRRPGRKKPSAAGGEEPSASTPLRPTPPRRRGRDEGLDEVDRILDKIRATGMDSLTPRERAFLDEVSRQYRETKDKRPTSRTH